MHKFYQARTGLTAEHSEMAQDASSSPRRRLRRTSVPPMVSLSMISSTAAAAAPRGMLSWSYFTRTAVVLRPLLVQPSASNEQGFFMHVQGTWSEYTGMRATLLY